MKIAVLFDGAGLARLGLEQAGHECTGFELDPKKHALSKHVGSGNCHIADVRDVDISNYDAVWASPPCQKRSLLNTRSAGIGRYSDDLLEWSLKIDVPILWVENVIGLNHHDKSLLLRWGPLYNAAQFTDIPLQNRLRRIGGSYFPNPLVYREFRRSYIKEGAIPCITRRSYQEKKMYHFEKLKARPNLTPTGFLGRPPTIDEMALYQGFEIPSIWWEMYRHSLIADGIGNGVPVYMARAFGAVYIAM